jgi:hypothetical protein
MKLFGCCVSCGSIPRGGTIMGGRRVSGDRKGTVLDGTTSRLPLGEGASPWGPFRTGRTEKQAYDNSSVQNRTTVPVRTRTTENRLCQKSTLSSYVLRPRVSPAAPPHHKYDHSAAIWSQNTTLVRPKAKKSYDRNLAGSTATIKSVTAQPLQGSCVPALMTQAVPSVRLRYVVHLLGSFTTPTLGTGG